MSTSAVSGTSQSSSSSSSTTDAYKKLDLNQFVKMLVSELQNQDPLNPMSNSELLQQVSQIRNIESSDRLTSTLESVLLGQNLATAGNMISKTITGLDQDGKKVTGKVDRVAIKDGVAQLIVGDSTIDLNNVAEIDPEGTTSSTTTNTGTSG